MSVKGKDNLNTCMNCCRAVQRCGKYYGAMLGEGIRQGRRKLKLFKVVAICDHLCLFFCCQIEHEVVALRQFNL